MKYLFPMLCACLCFCMSAHAATPAAPKADVGKLIKQWEKHAEPVSAQPAKPTVQNKEADTKAEATPTAPKDATVVITEEEVRITKDPEQNGNPDERAIETIRRKVVLAAPTLKHITINYAPATLRVLIPEFRKHADKFKKVVKLELPNNFLTDEEMAFIAQFTGLQEVNLHSNRFTDKSAQFFVGLKNIRVLSLSDNNRRVDGDFVINDSDSDEEDGKSRGEVLGIGSEWLKTISQMKHLTDLNLAENKLTDDQLTMLLPLKSQLTRLNLYKNKLTAAAMKTLGQFIKLSVLHLSKNQLVNADMGTLVGLAGLRELYLNYTGIRIGTVKSIRQLKNLTVLDIGANNLPTRTVVYVAQLPNLVSLDISQNKIREEAVPYLLGLKKLHTLNLYHTGIAEDELLRILEGLPHLIDYHYSRDETGHMITWRMDVLLAQRNKTPFDSDLEYRARKVAEEDSEFSLTTEKTVPAIEDKGASAVSYNSQESLTQALDAGVRKVAIRDGLLSTLIPYRSNIRELRLGAQTISTREMQVIGALSNLSGLSFNVKYGLSDEDFARYISPLSKLTYLSIPKCQLSISGLRALANLKGLVYLNLEQNRFYTANMDPESKIEPTEDYEDKADNTTEVIAVLARMSNLEELNLAHNDLTATSAKSLTPSNWRKLRVLDLSDNGNSWGPDDKRVFMSLGRDWMQAVSQLPALVELNLYGNKLSDADIEPLAKSAKLEKLNLRGNNLTDKSGPVLAKLHSMRELQLDDNQFTTAVIPALAEAKNLENLSIPGLKPGNNAAAELKSLASMQKLSVLNLSNNEVGGDILASLIAQLSLRELHLSKTGITAAGLKTLAQSPILQVSLEMLDLSGNNLGAEEVEYIAQFRGLRSLSVYEAKLTDDQLQEIAQRLPFLTEINAFGLSSRTKSILKKNAQPKSEEYRGKD